ncbi:MAG TPA: alpha/beta hydrolase [Planctomycetaceae bacterium]|nr:alpha/beta hydrolase [Planctomycetaceae bacterium]
MDALRIVDSVGGLPAGLQRLVGPLPGRCAHMETWRLEVSHSNEECVMRTVTMAVALAAASLWCVGAPGAESRRAGRAGVYPPQLPGADQVEVYKTVGDVKLKIFIYFPNDRRPERARPAIVFFFGGGFMRGSPKQFEAQCEYFASRGMVSMTADYRVKTRHDTDPADAVADGRDAIRWVRTHAKRLGVDPNRIVASGGSAGGMIAACVGVIPTLDEGVETPSVSYRPNAMVLFNPAIMGKEVPAGARASVRRRFTEQIMPFHHVRAGLPPMIMFFGTADRLLAGARQFQEAAAKRGNCCELMTWEGLEHGFFNYGRHENKPFRETVEAADRFLVSLGYLEGEPAVQEFLNRWHQRTTR